MNPQVDRLTDKARDQFENIVSGARHQTEQAAGRVKKGKKPVKTLSRMGQELSSISHRATTKVVKSQARLIENQIDAFAGRLNTAAHATSVRGLVSDQIRLFPENAAQFVEDTRNTIAAVAEAGGEVRQLFSGTLSELRGTTTSVPKKAPAKKVAKKTAKTTSKKRISKKAAAATKAAKKTAAKTAAKAADAVAGKDAPKAA
ncbi:MAG: phasin family protein [Pseudomonadota bacterium]